MNKPFYITLYLLHNLHSLSLSLSLTQSSILSFSLSLSIYIYIYMCVCVCVRAFSRVCEYVCVHTHQGKYVNYHHFTDFGGICIFLFQLTYTVQLGTICC